MIQKYNITTDKECFLGIEQQKVMVRSGLLLGGVASAVGQKAIAISFLFVLGLTYSGSFGQSETLVDVGEIINPKTDPKQAGDILYYRKINRNLPGPTSEIWRTDLKSGKVEKLFDSEDREQPQLITSVGKYMIYKRGDVGSGNVTLWASDGTKEGTFSIYSTKILDFIVVTDGTQLYFVASLKNNEDEIYNFNFQTKALKLLAKVNGVSSSSSHFRLFDSKILFYKKDDLYALNTAGGEPVFLASFDGGDKYSLRDSYFDKSTKNLYLRVRFGDEYIFWETNGTPEGTRKVIGEKEIIVGGFSSPVVKGKLGDKLLIMYSNTLYTYDLNNKSLNKLVDEKLTEISSPNYLVGKTSFNKDLGYSNLIIVSSVESKTLKIAHDFQFLGIVDDHVYIKTGLSTQRIKLNTLKEDTLHFRTITTSDVHFAKLGEKLYINQGTNLVELSGTSSIIQRGYLQTSDFFTASNRLYYFQEGSGRDINLRFYSPDSDVKTISCLEKRPKESYYGPGSICTTGKEYELYVKAEVDLGTGSNFAMSAFQWYKDGLPYKSVAEMSNGHTYISDPGVYRLQIAYVNLCSYTFENHTVMDKGDFRLTLEPTGEAVVCADKNVEIAATVHDKTNYYTYKKFDYSWWQGDKKMNSSESRVNNQTFRARAYAREAGEYRFTITNEFGCTATVIKQVQNGDPTETPVIEATSTSIKTNETTMLKVTKTFSSYQWYRNGGTKLTDETESTLKVSAVGKYHVVVQNPGKCEAKSAEMEITLNTGTGTGTPLTATISSPSTTAYAPQTITLTANSGTGYTYQWRRNGTHIPGATAATYEAKESGTYTVVITANGQSVTSNNIVLVIQVPLAREPEVSGITVSIFPNPVDRQVNAEIRLSEELPVRVEIYTLDGRRMKQWHSESKNFVHRPEIVLGNGLEGQQLLLKVSTDKAFVTQKIFVK